MYLSKVFNAFYDLVFDPVWFSLVEFAFRTYAAYQLVFSSVVVCLNLDHHGVGHGHGLDHDFCLVHGPFVHVILHDVFPVRDADYALQLLHVPYPFASLHVVQSPFCAPQFERQSK